MRIKITIRPISSNYLKNYENDYFHYKKIITYIAYRINKLCRAFYKIKTKLN